jgi:hypothetical protein
MDYFPSSSHLAFHHLKMNVQLLKLCKSQIKGSVKEFLNILEFLPFSLPFVPSIHEKEQNALTRVLKRGRRGEIMGLNYA